MKVFESYRVDTTNHCLWRHEERVPLTPKAFDVLRYLVEHADRLVTQEEILEALWPETYVNPEGIRKYILEVRKALGGQAQYIETVPKRGYRFLAKLTEKGATHAAPVHAELAENVVGRDAELRQLLDHLAKAGSGRRQMVFVSGEAGIGKSTLVDLFQESAVRPSRLRVARGQCIEGFGGKEPYYPLLEAVGLLVRNGEDRSWVDLLARQAPTWLVQFPSLVDAGMRESLQREILGSTRERMVREFCEALESMSAQMPLVLILEDLHWADPSTLDLISAVARRREPARLLIIGTYRPVDVVLSQSPLKALKQDLLVRHLCHEIAVERLEERDVAEYLSKEFAHHGFPGELAALIHHNSGGNALFMAAIVRDMVKKGLIAEDQGTWALTAALPDVYPGIPETLQQMLEIQFEQLSPEEQRILEACSLAGERFSVWAAAAILKMAPERVEETCERVAQRKQFIRFARMQEAASGAEAAHYEFQHSLYRQALYRRISVPSRWKLHRNLGEALMPICDAGKRELAAELALHLEEGREIERATHYWILVSDIATSRFSYRDSIQILRHALELALTVGSDRGVELEIEIQGRIGDALYILGDMTESALCYEAAEARAAQAGLQSARVGALLRLAAPAWHLDAERGDEVSGQAVKASEGLEDLQLAAQARLAAASFRLIYDKWREQDVEVCARAQETIDRLTGSRAVKNVFYLYALVFQGEYQEALEQCEALMRTTTDPMAYGQACGARGSVMVARGQLGDVLGLIRSEYRSAEKNGTDPWIWTCGVAWLCLICFDFEGAVHVSQGMRSNAAHIAWISTVARLAAGYAEFYAGNHAAALACFAEVRDFRITPKFFLNWYWRLHADFGTVETLMGAGDLAAAHREADDCVQSALSCADPTVQALAWEMRSRVARAEGDSDGARGLIGNALAITEEYGIPVPAWQVHRTAADVYADAGDHNRAEAHRARARELIIKIANSFGKDEPLGKSLLTAPPVRRLFGHGASV